AVYYRSTSRLNVGGLRRTTDAYFSVERCCPSGSVIFSPADQFRDTNNRNPKYYRGFHHYEHEPKLFMRYRGRPVFHRHIGGGASYRVVYGRFPAVWKR